MVYRNDQIDMEGYGFMGQLASGDAEISPTFEGPLQSVTSSLVTCSI